MSWFHLPLYGKSVPTSTQKFNLLPIIVLEKQEKSFLYVTMENGKKE